MTRLFASPDKSRCSQLYLANLDPFAKSVQRCLRLNCQSLDKSRPQTSISLFSYSIRVEICDQSESRHRYLGQSQAAESRQQNDHVRQIIFQMELC